MQASSPHYVSFVGVDGTAADRVAGPFCLQCDLQVFEGIGFSDVGFQFTFRNPVKRIGSRCLRILASRCVVMTVGQPRTSSPFIMIKLVGN